jgi:hypothetical protein
MPECGDVAAQFPGEVDVDPHDRTPNTWADDEQMPGLDFLADP